MPRRLKDSEYALSSRGRVWELEVQFRAELLPERRVDSNDEKTSAVQDLGVESGTAEKGSLSDTATYYRSLAV